MAISSSVGMTEEERLKVLQWLKEHWTESNKCPISGHNMWQLAEHLVYPLTYTGRGILVGGPTYPQVMLICGGCGYTIYLNAAMMGLVPPLEAPKPEPEPGEVDAPHVS